ncbi:MAG: ribokinase [Asticcacaulis sp.]|nr:ribokinase [Asticcacaulis sp.]
MRKPIVVIGSINFDFILDVAALPKPAETLIGTGLKTAIGGKGLNQAVACANSGIPTRMIAAVGDDAFGAHAISHLAAHGVAADNVKTLAGVSTGVANIIVAQGGENMIIVTPGANSRLSPADIDAAEAVIKSAAAVIVQLEVPLPAVRRALEIARSHKVLTVVNPAPVDLGVLELLPLADLVTPNETELMRLTGIEDLSDKSLINGLNKLHKAGARRALVTLGAEGCATLISGQLVRQPAYKVDAVDTTGAGDVFNGALVSRVVSGASIVDAMRYAAAAAALSVKKASADSAPRSAEVDALMAEQTA